MKKVLLISRSKGQVSSISKKYEKKSSNDETCWGRLLSRQCWLIICCSISIDKYRAAEIPWPGRALPEECLKVRRLINALKRAQIKFSLKLSALFTLLETSGRLVLWTLPVKAPNRYTFEVNGYSFKPMRMQYRYRLEYRKPKYRNSLEWRKKRLRRRFLYLLNTVHIGYSDWPPSRGLRSL